MTYQTIPLKLLLPVCLLIILFAGYQLLIHPLKQQLTHAQQQTTTLQQQLTKITQQVSDLNKAKIIQPDSYTKKLEQQISINKMIDSIVTLANAKKVEVKSINPEPSIQVKTLAQQPLTIVVRGNYHALLAFIQNLMQMPIFIVIENFELNKPSAQNSLLLLQMRLVVYSTGAPENA